MNELGESVSSARWPDAPAALTVPWAACVACLVYLLLIVRQEDPEGLALVTLIPIVLLAGMLTLRLSGWIAFDAAIGGTLVLFFLFPMVLLATAFGADRSPGLIISWVVIWSAFVVVVASLIALIAKGVGALAQIAVTNLHTSSGAARQREATARAAGAFLVYLGLTVLLAVGFTWS